MPSAIDLTLPETNDHAVEAHKFNKRTKQYCAVYFHVSLPLSLMSDLIALLNSELETAGSDIVCAAPDSDRVGRPLLSSFQAHKHIGVNTVFHPWFYIAVVEKSFEQNGVILVNMGSSKDTPVQTMRVPAQEAGAAFANLQISHLEWSELEEQFAHLNSTPESDADSSSNNEDDDPYCPDYAIGIYVLVGVSEDAVLRALCGTKPHGPSPYGIQGNIAPCSVSPSGFKMSTAALTSEVPAAGSADATLNAYDQRAVTFAVTEYMTQPEQQHGIHDSMFLIADRPDIEQDGLLLVQINRETKNPVVFQAQRVPAVEGETLQLFVKIDTGLRPFHISHWSFVLQCRREEDAWRIAGLIDAEAAERVHGDEKIVVVSEAGEHVFSSGAATLDMVVKPWPVVCHHERFKHNLHRHLFLFGGEWVQSPDDEVTIVDAEWNPSEEMVAQGAEMLDLRNKTRTMQVKCSEVYEMLRRLADKEIEWPVRT